ncbi:MULTISPECIES: metallophosphoesterase family protein [unclassified Roseitalea]|uniref:metallophosphoesterase family protein n=1 Tax=unclassified Roseitalea TaxID=2639107 RepID=UPI00273EC4AA|nr:MULTISPECIES: metallophosphoesterase family protein [unclassified Roseitalea]
MFYSQARLPQGMRVYAIGDVHGYRGLLDTLLQAIDAELAENPPADYRIVCLGDYCDRGPDTPGVIETLIARRAADSKLVCLKGNHDDWMLTMLSDPHAVASGWLAWGGRETLRSYGIDHDHAGRDLDALSAVFSAALPAAHRAFLESLALFHVQGDFLFVHAGIRPDVAIKDQAPDDLLWIREPFLGFRGSLGKVVVHGHTIHPRPMIFPNRIAIDTGVYRTGILCGAVLEGSHCRFMSARRSGVVRH